MEKKKKSSYSQNRAGGHSSHGNFSKQRKNANRFERKPEKAEFQGENTLEESNIHGDYENGAVIGRNAVRELLRSDRSIDKLMVQRGERTGSIVVLVAEAIERGIPVLEVEKAKLDALSGYAPHQGVIALAAEKEYCTVEDILAIAEERGEAPLIVVCDGITDPYNLGAIIRCAECCGAHGLIIPKRRAVGLTPLVTKASAGAVEHLAVAKVANIATTLETLKKAGVWTYAAEAGGESLYDTDLSGPVAIVLGSEGNGVSQLVKKTCDAIVSIPMYGKVNSFNVSTAAAILLAETARRHH
ncbi:MAG: 23S rRNA (guanosine(2251)-2'-O)-methyltransferase RlmB [Clostridia bacterium]|nr:23S rRNA (guanosine(2251)-2'-O)-methyltransferase RlmB [Clostridia bacterium]